MAVARGEYRTSLATGREGAGKACEDGGSPTGRKQECKEGGKGFWKGEGEVVGEGQDASVFVWQRELGPSEGCVDEDARGLSRVPNVSHAQLVEYLMWRGGEGARVMHIPFEGVNQVVYCIATSQPT
jgi:hypothetical protein